MVQQLFLYRQNAVNTVVILFILIMKEGSRWEREFIILNNFFYVISTSEEL